jgi:hypothetical protein
MTAVEDHLELGLRRPSWAGTCERRDIGGAGLRGSRSGDGPAPDPGRRRDAQIPMGVTARMDSTKS